jgi:hypothetical protein
MHVESVRVIFPPADLSGLLQKDIAALGTAIIIPTMAPPGKKPF